MTNRANRSSTKQRGFAVFFVSVIASLAVSADWDTRFKEVCTYDAYCRRLRTSDGTWLKPKPEIIAVMRDKEIQAQIHDIAKKYSLDATAIASVILAENSLNVGLKDDIQTWLAKKGGITGIGSYRFTFGFGQISIRAAAEAERHVAALEGRAAKSDDELTKEITDPMGSIRLAGAILRKVQDDYKAQGFDISKDLSLQATLYNLGQSEERAKRAKESGVAPRANYFGLFVDKYTPEVRGLIRAAPAQAPTVAAAVIPASAPPPPAAPAPTISTATKTSQTPAPRSVASKPPGSDPAPATPVRAAPKKELKLVAKSSVSLLSAPMSCRSDGYGQDPVKEAKSTTYGAPTGVLEAGSTITELSRTLDCKSNAWKLIRSSDGTTGWIQESRLDKVMQQQLVTPQSCRPSPQRARCVASLKEKLGTSLIEADAEKGLLSIRPIAAPETKEVSFDNEDRECGFRPEVAEDTPRRGRRNRSPVVGGNPNQPPETPRYDMKALKKENEEARDFLQKELDRMAKATGLKPDELGRLMNPYQSLYHTMYRAMSNVTTCLDTLRTENIQCETPTRVTPKYRELLSQVSYDKIPDLEKLHSVMMELDNALNSVDTSFISFNYYQNQHPDVNPTTSPKIIRESLFSCNSRLSALTEKVFQEIANKPAPSPTPQANQMSMGGLAGMPGMGMVMPGTGMMGGYGTYGGGYSPMGGNDKDLLDLMKSASDEVVEKHAASLTAAAKFCHARLNLLDPSSSKRENPLDCAEAPEIIQFGFQNFARDIAQQLYRKNPSMLLNEVFLNVQMMVPAAAKTELAGEDPQKPNLPSPLQQDTYVLPEGSYCPNRTAEQIEEILKSNADCVSNVFVPTEFLVKRLSADDERVVFQKFEKNDRFMIEVGAARCATAK